MNALVRAVKGFGRCLNVLLVIPVRFLCRTLLRPVILGVYRRSFPVRLWVRNLLAPAKNLFFYPLTTRYVAHILIGVMTVVVSSNSLIAKELQSGDEGRHGLLAALVQTEGDESMTTIIPNAQAQTQSVDTSVLSSESLPTEASDGPTDDGAPVDALEKPLLSETTFAGEPRQQIVHYLVEGGDALSTIAEKFGISTRSILWANGLLETDFIKPGQDLTIPPVSGVLHTVKAGDTLNGIAQKYKADGNAILEFNLLADPAGIEVGDVLVVPGGVIEEAATIPSLRRYQPPQVFASPTPPPSAISRRGSGFLWPVGTRQISQGFYRYHQGADLRAPNGSAIYSADDGTVESVVYQRYGYGYHVVVNHGGGIRTLYAHASKIYVKPGQHVDRGQAIAAIGMTGRTTGPHLHFEVFRNGSKVNPFGYLTR